MISNGRGDQLRTEEPGDVQLREKANYQSRFSLIPDIVYKPTVVEANAVNWHEIRHERVHSRGEHWLTCSVVVATIVREGERLHCDRLTRPFSASAYDLALFSRIYTG